MFLNNIENMKINKPTGSKDRLFEMMEKVNTVKLNEEYNPNSVLDMTFQQLKNGTLNIEHSNTQANGDENYVELICVDKQGNNATFTFAATSTEGDQEGVFKVDNVQLKSFSFDAADGSDSIDLDENGLKQFNAQHASEFYDVIDGYLDVDSEDAEVEANDSLYEDAVKKIDSYPFGGGNERMQTGKAYADEKPTNPKLRVKAPELDNIIENMDDINKGAVMGNPHGEIIKQAIQNVNQRIGNKQPANLYQYRDMIQEEANRLLHERISQER